jgi:uncharacterized protein YraI
MRTVLYAAILITLLIYAETRRNSREQNVLAVWDTLQDLYKKVIGTPYRTTAALNVRDSPCTNGNKITTVKEGTMLLHNGESVDGCGYTWYSVRGSFGTGWAASKYLVASPISNPSATPSTQVGDVDYSSYPTTYTANGHTFTDKKAQVLHFLKAKFTAIASTYNGHAEGATQSADLWTKGARYTVNNGEMESMNSLADYVAQNLKSLGLKYIIWKQRIWTVGSGKWKQMEDRGSITKNHFDHVHITFAS